MKFRALALRQNKEKWPTKSYRFKRHSQLRGIFTMVTSPSSTRFVLNSRAQDAFSALMITAT